MIDFLKKFENRGIKIARVSSILITKSIKFTVFPLILHGVGVRCDRRRFSGHSPFIEVYMLQKMENDFQHTSKSMSLFFKIILF